MKRLLAAICALDPKSITYESLGDLVYSFGFADLDYRQHLPAPASDGSYSRNILLLDPVEVVLLRWPPGCASAVHHHAGFYGYVVVLEGHATDEVFRHHDGRVDEQSLSLIGPGGVLHEPDGTLHRIVNASAEAEMVSLHIYFPALESLDGLVLYDLAAGRLGELGPKAASASWTEPREHFRRLEEQAFQYRDWVSAHPSLSHRTVVIKPKPGPDAVREMIASYYDEQARVYDFFDFTHPTRKAYTDRVNLLVGEALQARPTAETLLGVACGTGRRADEITAYANREMQVTGVDMSPGMVAVARERGLDMVEGNWLDADLADRLFDAAIFLYSFGHLCNASDRLASLKKLRAHLKPGGLLCVDLFNRDDRHEWGPIAMKHFHEQNLAAAGYEPGDVFYRKADGSATAFLHYFTEAEIRELWPQAGFRVERIQYVGYTHASGELVSDHRDGFFFVEATAV